jgi:hypothetical protein
MGGIRIAAIILGWAAAAAGAGTAFAHAPTGAAPQQYVEVLPGAGGATTAPAPSGASSAAQQYVEVVPSAAGGSGSGSLTAPAQATPASPGGAAVSAVASGDEGELIGLAVAMIVVTLWLLGAAAARYRRREAAARAFAGRRG